MKVQEVKATRHANIDKLFNREAALLAIQNTPQKVVRSGVLGDFSGDIVKIFETAGKGKELSLNQVKAAYEAATGVELVAKKFADRCWLLSDKNSKNKAPVLKAGSTKGTYVLA